MGNPFAEKSEAVWNEGNACLARGEINGAANRIYYSVFQAVKGFAVATGKMAMDEAVGVHAKALRIVGESGSQRFYYKNQMSKLAGLREIADYYPESVDKQRLEELLADAAAIREHFLTRSTTRQ